MNCSFSVESERLDLNLNNSLDDCPHRQAKHQTTCSTPIPDSLLHSCSTTVDPGGDHAEHSEPKKSGHTSGSMSHTDTGNIGKQTGRMSCEFKSVNNSANMPGNNKQPLGVAAETFVDQTIAHSTVTNGQILISNVEINVVAESKPTKLKKVLEGNIRQMNFKAIKTETASGDNSAAPVKCVNKQERNVYASSIGEGCDNKTVTSNKSDTHSSDNTGERSEQDIDKPYLNMTAEELQGLEDCFDEDDEFEDTRTPLERFRPGYLWVSDITRQSWCEQQLYYSFTEPSLVEDKPVMTEGTNLHLERGMAEIFILFIY